MSTSELEMRTRSISAVERLDEILSSSNRAVRSLARIFQENSTNWKASGANFLIGEFVSPEHEAHEMSLVLQQDGSLHKLWLFHKKELVNLLLAGHEYRGSEYEEGLEAVAYLHPVSKVPRLTLRFPRGKIDMDAHTHLTFTAMLLDVYKEESGRGVESVTFSQTK